MIDQVKVLSGTAHKEFAEQLCKQLNIELGKCDCGKFSNGETRVIVDESIRSKDVYIVQPTCNNINDNIMELLVIVDAVRRASAKHITAVIPFWSYGKQCKKEAGRQPIVTNFLEKCGVQRVISMDLEAPQISGFFSIPVDNLYAEPLIVKYIEKHIKGERVVVSPAVDGVKRAKLVSDKLNCDLAILDRQSKESLDDMVLVGDVSNKVAIIIGSIADTCETLALGAKVLKKRGALEVYALVSHGELSGSAIETLNQSELKELVITNSIPTNDKVKQCPKIKVINVAPMFAEAIRRIVHGESVTATSNKFTIL
ncbi:phosphoribosyl pyrophosphate synthetase [Cavenderia fasciculata]|uniref:ribose-phosphate diphosphokinase n=1 Tax=Cavenderia fasciculata TaxID=261658 RepID=F4PXA6_CACFS|nr:phosphoribosyl pyrophosphate synthetase [Cavenderia fasciculata]EGG19909.1 phosphoribosyl pyrophosphate synthetase [Cavenderia fasciculata]|eukprot:XP_004366892.1 phosphoribosyl pyrophosphate synthetase [Cavenderia fasciculata]